MLESRPASLFRCLLSAFALVAALSLPAAPRASEASQTPATPRVAPVAREVRALWVLRSSLTSPEQISRLVRDARSSGFNTLLVQVRGRGDAYFNQGLEPLPPALANKPDSFDPLAQVVSAGHAAGLRVHAWVNVNLVASATLLPKSPAHLIKAHPEWLMVPRQLARELHGIAPSHPSYVAALAAWTRRHAGQVEGLFSSPVPVEAARHVEAIVSDLARRYALDGVHLDYIRYPSPDFDYSRAALAAFRESVIKDLSATERLVLDRRLVREPFVYVDKYPQRWTTFRRARLTDLVARIRQAVKAHRPNAILSAAVIADANEAAIHRLQDWQDWSARGLLDVICPMAYTADMKRFSRTVADATRFAAPQPLWAGIGAFKIPSTQTVAHIRAARAAGAEGIALFSYDSLMGPSLSTIGRAAFGDAGLPVASSR